MYFFIMCPQLVLQIEMTNVSRRCEVGRAEPRRSDCAPRAAHRRLRVAWTRFHSDSSPQHLD